MNGNNETPSPRGAKRSGPPRAPNFRLLPLLLVFLGVMVLFNLWAMPKSATKSIPYSEFRDLLAKGQLTEVVLEDRVVRGQGTPTATGEAPKYVAVRVDDPKLVEDLRAAGVKFSGHVAPTFWRDLASWVVPILILVLIWSFVFRRMAGGQAGLGGAMGFGRTRARLASPEEVKETFRDVAGVDEAKAELEEIVAYLRTPERFRRLGGKIPKGVLLVGPPGTGKTLLARAVAGEARVSFFSLSGSEFVEMFVGVGAARVRDLFAKAKEHAPCIIFIDELDAIGKARGIGGALSGHDEREQTLNQLLAEMDGFEANTGVIIMAATNRPEILDPALQRPGRFDRQVLVDRPDLSGRRAILDVHVGNIKLAPEVDLDRVAQQTPGLVGADLANIVNEAALLAARHDHEAVTMTDFQEAIERVLVGLEKKSRIMRPEERRRIAYHESGHALVGETVETGDPVLKISIIPRGMSALGHTLQMPTEDRYLMTRAELLDKLTTLLGGRAAEEIVFGEVSTGAQNDLQRAADIARSMVLEFGMSERFGPVAFERERRPMFLDTGALGSSREFSERTAEAIDQEIEQLVRGAHERAVTILQDNRELLEKIAGTLLEVEMIDRARLLELMGRPDEETASGDTPDSQG